MNPKRRKSVGAEFNYKPWKVVFCESMDTSAGECADGPRMIFLGEDVSRDNRFSTALHEGLHACFPYLDENTIKRAEENLVAYLEVLKKSGYLVKNKKES